MLNKIFLFLFIVMGCASTHYDKPCHGENQKERGACRAFFQKKIKTHPANTIVFWQKYMEKPVSQRVFVVDKNIVELIHLNNLQGGYPEVPVAVDVEEEFINEVKQALSELPAKVMSPLKDKFAGVYLMKDFGGSGLTDYIFDERDSITAAYMILDVEVLKKRIANEWASWKRK